VCFYPADLSTEFVHKYVDRRLSPGQTPWPRKGLRYAARVFASASLAAPVRVSMQSVPRVSQRLR
jgi:hypothetical protein